MLRRARETATELGLDAHQSERLYRLIIDMSVSQQQSHLLELETVPLQVAFLGVEGGPGQLAAQARFGGRRGGALLEGHPALTDAVEAVRSGRADVALLALESTAEGSTRTMDLLTDAGLVSAASGCSAMASTTPATSRSAASRDGPRGRALQDLGGRHPGRSGRRARTRSCSPFSRQGVNLTRIESRPVPGTPPRFRFFIDMEGHAAGERVSRALEEARATRRSGWWAPIRRTG